MKNNKQNTEWVGYATPNKAARDKLPKEVREDIDFTQKKNKIVWKFIRT